MGKKTREYQTKEKKATENQIHSHIIITNIKGYKYTRERENPSEEVSVFRLVSI